MRSAILQAAAESADKMKGFGLADGSTTPAFGRVIVVFLLLAALAWGAAWLLRRYGSARWRNVATGGVGPIQPLARTSLPGGIACHLVEAQGSRVLITVTRHGVSSLLLGATDAKNTEPAP